MEGYTIDQLAEMSDDEIANLSASHLSPQAVPQEVPQASDGEVQPNGETEDVGNDDQQADDETDHTDAGDGHEDGDAGESQEEQTNANTNSLEGVDLEGFYKALTAPIKAAGREITINSAEEAVRLIQMGVDYGRKNAEHKRDRGVVKALDSRGINDPEILGFLADVHEGKKEAIAKLLKQHKVDLFEFDTEQAENYVPQKAQVPEAVIELDDVLEDLQANSPTFNRTLDTINSWDDESRLVASKDPNFIRVVDREIASGRFDQVDNLVHRAMTLGYIPSNTPYLEAYRTCEAELRKAEEAKKPAQKIRAPRPTAKADNVNRNRVAVPSGGNAAPTTITSVDQLAAMSDDDILKLTL